MLSLWQAEHASSSCASSCSKAEVSKLVAAPLPRNLTAARSYASAACSGIVPCQYSCVPWTSSGA